MSVRHRVSELGVTAMLLMNVSVADAQDRRTSPSDLSTAQANRIDASGSLGRLPTTATGQLGQRQTSGQAAANVIPGGRIEARINNRVASRLDTRIGGAGYRAQADALSAYGKASEEASSTTRKIRR